MTWIIANKIAKLILNDNLGDIKRLLEPYSREERRRITSEKVKRRPLLFLAIKESRISIVDYLLDNCDVKPDYLWLAAATANLSVVISLLEHGADINSIDQWGRTALFKACWIGYLDMVEYLLDNGTDINKTDYSGTTSLMVSLKNVYLFKYLLSKGACIDQVNAQGKTALMLAVETRNIACIQLLLSCNADAKCTNGYGENAIFLAASSNQMDVLEKFQSKSYHISNEVALDKEIRSCNHSVCRHPEKAEILWKSAMSLRNLPTNTPIFQTADPANTDEILREVLDYFEPIDRRAITFLTSRLGLLNPYTLTLFCEAATRISDVGDFMVVIRFFFEIVKPAEDRLFCKTFLENSDLIEKFIRRNYAEQNPELRFSRLLEMFKFYAAHIQEAGKRIQQMNATEKISSFFYMEAFFSIFLDFVLTIGDQYPGGLQSFKEVIKTLIAADLRSFGNASLLHVCIVKRYPSNLTKTLLSCGADTNCKDDEGRTPVHYALESPVYRTKPFIESFLQHGFRFDLSQVDDPCLACYLNKADLLRTPVEYVSLQCLAAKAVAANRLNYENYLPPNLQIMIFIHS